MRANTEYEQQAEQQQHVDADLPAFEARRLGHVVHVIDEIGDRLVVFDRRQRAGAGLQRLHHVALTALPSLDSCVTSSIWATDFAAISAAVAACSDSNSSSYELLLAVQLPQHVRHADVGKHQIVPAGRPRRVAVERTQVGVYPVGAAARAGTARTRGHREIGRRHAEPFLGVLPVHRDLHQFADLDAGKDQVVPDLLFGEAEVLQPVVAHVTGAVAVEAIVDEQLGAVLQRCQVVRIDRRGLQPRPFRRRRRERREQRRENRAADESADGGAYHVNLAGSGLHWSILEYHGIRMKNRK